MTLHAFLLVLLLAPAVSAAPATPTAKPAAHPAAGTPSHSVRITGAVKAPAEFDVAALKKLLPRNSGPVDVVCASGATVGPIWLFLVSRTW